MFSKSDIVIRTIGRESLYVMEKSGTAIYKQPGVDVDLAISLLSNYQEGLIKLKQEIDRGSIYDNSYFDFEFATSLFAINKLISLLSHSRTDDQDIEASIYQQHIRQQDDTIRRAIEESEEN